MAVLGGPVRMRLVDTRLFDGLEGGGARSGSRASAMNGFRYGVGKVWVALL